MSDKPSRPAEETALARFAAIAPIVTRTLDKGESRAVRRAILDQIHSFPDESHRKISERTLRRWVADYRAALPKGTMAALEALYPAMRSDKGVPRIFTAEILEEAVKLKTELPDRSIHDILLHLEKAPKESTLAYHLRQRGATSAQLKTPGKAFKRYQAKGVNAMWQSDVMDGEFLPDPTCPDKFKEIHLMAFMDDFSRYVPHGEWYMKESLPCLFDTLKKGTVAHGCADRYYWDNGPIYRSRQVRLVAGRLGGKVIFSTPYAPEGRGKIERFFKTVRRSFVKEARHAGITTLPEWNKAFWAWLDRYHRRVHRTTRQTPHDRWHAGADQVRYPNPAEIHEIFLWEDSRLVRKTATISLAGNEYRVDDALVGKTIQVRYDPLDLATVRIYVNDQFRQVAEPAQLVTHTHRKATPHRKADKYLPLPSSKRLMERLVAEHQEAAQAVVIAALGPPQDAGTRTIDPLDHLDLAAFRVVVEKTLGKALDGPDLEACEPFFRRYAPFRCGDVATALTDIVATKGTDRHLEFYLDELAHAMRRR
jgi:transposase InsO family protein